MHLVSIEPGQVRGNHRHPTRNEWLLVHARGNWELAWKPAGEDAAMCHQAMLPGAVTITLPAGIAHALKNTGDRPLWALSWSDRPTGPTDTETVSLLV